MYAKHIQLRLTKNKTPGIGKAVEIRESGGKKMVFVDNEDPYRKKKQRKGCKPQGG